MKKISAWDAVVLCSCALNSIFALTTPWIGAIGWILAGGWFFRSLIGADFEGKDNDES